MDTLSRLMDKHGSDKGPNHHNYSESYYKIFKGLQNSPLVFLEIGVGGYHYLDRGGGSLKAWEEFFPNSHIHGIDIYDKSYFNKGRVHTHIISQNHEQQLVNLINVIGKPDVILDDGSHINQDVIFTFEILFPRLKSGGIYIVEDTETAYYPDYGFGGCSDPYNCDKQTSMSYFHDLTHDLNHKYIPDHVHIFGDKIENISFYKGFIAIYKK